MEASATAMEPTAAARSPTIVSAPKTAAVISAVESGTIKQVAAKKRVGIGVIETIIARSIIGGAVIAGPIIARRAGVIGTVGAVAVRCATGKRDP
jgi:hypothetical protein